MKKKQVFNPYLPLTTYIPDGEPHKFGGRVYIYGSHDKPQGKAYCEDHYEVWSAPEDDLTDWRCEGTSYRRWQDPSNSEDTMQLWAPDITQGPDGRYYLYYCYSFYPEIGVAVSKSPAGPFEFYGHVHYPAHLYNGAPVREFMPFDPAVMTDLDGSVYLYYGFAPAEEKEMSFPSLDDMDLDGKTEDEVAMLERLSKIQFSEGAMAVQLEDDMLTVKEVPAICVPGGHIAAGSGFEGHAFFEASSIRRINSKYYFVYSSHKSHELCYAISDHPMHGFRYGGTIVSNGDIGYKGRTKPANVLGNNHGGMVKANGEWYIFYHRQTNGTEFSRQGCAEKIEILPDGSIPQVEMTSCGLNGGPLCAEGTYPASIACHLTCPTTMDHIDYRDPVMQTQMRITQQPGDETQHITAVADGSVIGYKYFDFNDNKALKLKLKGKFVGEIYVAGSEEALETAQPQALTVQSEDYKEYDAALSVPNGKNALFLKFTGEGALDFESFTFV